MHDYKTQGEKQVGKRSYRFNSIHVKMSWQLLKEQSLEHKVKGRTKDSSEKLTKDLKQ